MMSMAQHARYARCAWAAGCGVRVRTAALLVVVVVVVVFS
jgi:hypothetical protein